MVEPHSKQKSPNSFKGICGKLAQGFQMGLLAASGSAGSMGKVMGTHIAFARNQLGTAFALQAIRPAALRPIDEYASAVWLDAPDNHSFIGQRAEAALRDHIAKAVAVIELFHL
jgi:hypothetical protein